MSAPSSNNKDNNTSTPTGIKVKDIKLGQGSDEVDQGVTIKIHKKIPTPKKSNKPGIRLLKKFKSKKSKKSQSLCSLDEDNQCSSLDVTISSYGEGDSHTSDATSLYESLNRDTDENIDTGSDVKIVGNSEKNGYLTFLEKIRAEGKRPSSRDGVPTMKSPAVSIVKDASPEPRAGSPGPSAVNSHPSQPQQQETQEKEVVFQNGTMDCNSMDHEERKSTALVDQESLDSAEISSHYTITVKQGVTTISWANDETNVEETAIDPQNGGKQQQQVLPTQAGHTPQHGTGELVAPVDLQIKLESREMQNEGAVAESAAGICDDTAGKGGIVNTNSSRTPELQSLPDDLPEAHQQLLQDRPPVYPVHRSNLRATTTGDADHAANVVNVSSKTNLTPQNVNVTTGEASTARLPGNPIIVEAAAAKANSSINIYNQTTGGSSNRETERAITESTGGLNLSVPAHSGILANNNNNRELVTVTPAQPQGSHEREHSCLIQTETGKPVIDTKTQDIGKVEKLAVPHCKSAPQAVETKSVDNRSSCSSLLDQPRYTVCKVMRKTVSQGGQGMSATDRLFNHMSQNSAHHDNPRSTAGGLRKGRIQGRSNRAKTLCGPFPDVVVNGQTNKCEEYEVVDKFLQRYSMKDLDSRSDNRPVKTGDRGDQSLKLNYPYKQNNQNKSNQNTGIPTKVKISPAGRTNGSHPNNYENLGPGSRAVLSKITPVNGHKGVPRITNGAKTTDVGYNTKALMNQEKAKHNGHHETYVNFGQENGFNSADLRQSSQSLPTQNGLDNINSKNVHIDGINGKPWLNGSAPVHAGLTRILEENASSRRGRPPAVAKKPLLWKSGQNLSSGGLKVTDPQGLPPTKKGTRHQSGGRAQEGRGRRHTVTVGGMDLAMDSKTHTPEFSRKQEQFLNHLAEKFPDHAHVITARVAPYGSRPSSACAELEQGSCRRGSSKSTTMPCGAASEYSEYSQDEDAMSEMNTSATGTFQRGSRLRASLPIVRTPNKTFEKPLGLVFLTYRNETKRALLPNEITSLDTVWALFVRSFPDNLSMRSVEDPHRKIYIMDATTKLFYQLEHVSEVQDKSVLKVIDVAQSPVPGSGRASPLHLDAPGSPAKIPSLSAHQAALMAESQVPPPPGPPAHHDYINPSLFHQPAAAHQVRSAHSSPQHRRQRSVSPAGSSGNQRHSLAYLPCQTSPLPPDVSLPQSRSYHDYRESSASRSGSTTPVSVDFEASRTRMDKMELQLANLTAWVQNAVTEKPPSRSNSTRSQTSYVSEGVFSMKTKSSTQNSEDSSTPVQTPTGSQPGMSEVSGAAQPYITLEMQQRLRELQCRAQDLQREMAVLRKTQVHNSILVRETVQQTFNKIKRVIQATPGALDIPVRSSRLEVDQQVQIYNDDMGRVLNDLDDLEASVEELRGDVLNKKCRVSLSEVESMALTLSRVSHGLGDLKGRFSQLFENLKAVMSGEMTVVVREESFLNEEPDRIDTALRRCKKITGTLFTLKRLGQVQGHKGPQVPALPETDQEPSEVKRAVLEDIQAVVPNHEQRITSIEECAASRERKKKITANQESVKFSKSLEEAQKKLRETNHAELIRQKQEALLAELYSEVKSESENRVHLPLTETTKKLSSNCRQEPKAPAKPPRTMEYGQNGEVEHEHSGRSETSSKDVHLVHRHGGDGPPVTSTPISHDHKTGRHSHVTFSPAVTEITSPDGMNGKKKIPPPPPPRRSSSRGYNKSPQMSPTKRLPIPIYENIDKHSSPETGAVTKQSKPQSNDVSRDLNSAGAKGQQMNKFQKDLAAGIYSNMNRPDLQGQKMSVAELVSRHESASPRSDLSHNSSDSDSVTSGSLDSQRGVSAATIKRNPKTVVSPSQIPQPTAAFKNGKADLSPTKKSKDVKKVPPPPPQRKTSKLSQKDDKIDKYEEKYEKLQKLQKELRQEMSHIAQPKSVSNGHSSSKSAASKKKQKHPPAAEETDIF